MSNSIHSLWKATQRLPAGKLAFSWALGRKVPYSGSIGARVEQLESGFAQILMKDRRRLRNHLGSLHAVALVNLGELASGLAMLTGLPKTARAIVVGIRVEYLKKARGPIVAECRCSPPTGLQKEQVEVLAVLKDHGGDTVAEVRATWLVSPAESSPSETLSSNSLAEEALS